MFRVRELYDACLDDPSAASTNAAEVARLALVQKKQEAEAAQLKLEAEEKKQLAERLKRQEIEAEQQRIANEKQLEVEAKKLEEAKRLVEEEGLKQAALAKQELEAKRLEAEIAERIKQELEAKRLEAETAERLKQELEAKRLEAETAERLKQELEAKQKQEAELRRRMEAEMKKQKEEEALTKKEEQKEVLDGNQFAEEYEPLFVFKKGNSISEKIARQPVADLFKAFSLNDKILFTKELFLGDAGAFAAALKEINEASDFEAVRSYLETTLIESNNWMDKNRQSRAKEFILLARRRHL